MLVMNTAWKVSIFAVILVRMRENADQNNSEYGHFLRSANTVISFKKRRFASQQLNVILFKQRWFASQQLQHHQTR